eukprot:1328600-Amphidinium_carterae.1
MLVKLKLLTLISHLPANWCNMGGHKALQTLNLLYHSYTHSQSTQRLKHGIDSNFACSRRNINSLQQLCL